eukprot:106277_1
MSTLKNQSSKPMEFRQRRPRQTSNPVVSNKPDIYFEFSTSKLGIRVRSGDDKQGLYVAAVTNEAPPSAKDKVPEGSQIISVNERNLEHSPFDEAVEHFAQLTLPITVRFRPPLYPIKKSTYNSHGHEHGHDHDHHDHHHHSHDEDDDEEGTCYIACYMILFVIAFMFIISMSLNGWPGIPTSLPSMPRLFPSKNRRNRRGQKNNKFGSETNDIIKEQLRQKQKGKQEINPGNNNRKILQDIVSDMNNIQNIVDRMDINLNDIEIDDLFKDGK